MLGNGGQVDDRRGINVFAVYHGEPLIIGSYDFFTTVEAANAFAADIRGLPEGTFVAIVACDEASRHWNANAQRALESIGGNRSAKGTLTGKYRHAYYCLGEKGATPGTAREAIDPAGGPLAYPAAYARQAKLVDEGPDEYRKEPRIRIIRGVPREVKW